MTAPLDFMWDVGSGDVLVTTNAHSFGDTTQRVLTAPLGTAEPPSPYAADAPAGWFDVGWLDDATGLIQAQSVQSTDKFGWQGSSLVRTVKSQAAQSFTFDALEENAVTYGLMRPASTQTTSALTTWDVKPFTGTNLRQFAVYLADGPVHKCLYIPTGEAISNASPAYKGGDLTVYSFTVRCYTDTLGRLYKEISDNPAIAAGLFT